jgi:hypothetical protein
MAQYYERAQPMSTRVPGQDQLHCSGVAIGVDVETALCIAERGLDPLGGGLICSKAEEEDRKKRNHSQWRRSGDVSRTFLMWLPV